MRIRTYNCSPPQTLLREGPHMWSKLQTTRFRETMLTQITRTSQWNTHISFYHSPPNACDHVLWENLVTHPSACEGRGREYCWNISGWTILVDNIVEILLKYFGVDNLGGQYCWNIVETFPGGQSGWTILLKYCWIFVGGQFGWTILLNYYFRVDNLGGQYCWIMMFASGSLSNSMLHLNLRSGRMHRAKKGGQYFNNISTIFQQYFNNISTILSTQIVFQQYFNNISTILST